MSRPARSRFTVLMPVLALSLATMLGGCVVYPDGGYGYGYGYGYQPAPYDYGAYGAPVVEFGVGGWGHGHHHR